ncbi:MAG: tripartite tricarboxylate transporter substrate binding protein [Pseudomonadota bacterium]
MNVNRRRFLTDSGCIATALSLFPATTLASSLSENPITAVVGYKQGGGTDSTARTLTPTMGEHLSGTVNIINRPGAVASLATDFVWNKPADGYWWLFSSTYNKLLRCNGYHNTVPYLDWQFYGVDVSIMSWSVPENSPIRDFGDLIARARKNPGSVTVSNSGTGGVWHLGNSLLESVGKLSFKNIAYKGGKDATLAALQGEVDVVGSGVHEHIDHIRSGRLRNLAVFSDRPLPVPGQESLIPASEWIPELSEHSPFGGGGSMALKRDTDPGILRSVEAAFLAATESVAFKDRLQKKYRFANVKTGEAADKTAALQEVVASKILHELGVAKFSNRDLGLPDPSEFESWWPPKGYESRI